MNVTLSIVMRGVSLLFLPGAYCMKRSDDFTSINAYDEAQSASWFIVGFMLFGGAVLSTLALIVLAVVMLVWTIGVVL